MKIIQVTPNYPLHSGGVQNVARQLAEGLARKGHEVEVFTSDMGGKCGRLESGKNLKLHYLASVEIAHTPIIFSLFFNLLTIPKDSIIHVHIARAFTSEVVYLISKIKKVPYIAHYHLDVESSGKWGFFLPLYKNIILKRVLKSASMIAVLTERYRTLISKKYNISRNVVIIPNGVSNRFFNLAKTKHESKKTNLLFVGRLNVQKNVGCLVEAVSLVKHPVILNIVGDGELKFEIRDLINNYKLNNVILHGNKFGEELIRMYQKAEIFLLASKSEGLPLVVLEAMAAGIPIIASDVIGNHEMVNEVGILVNPPTAANFAKEIDTLIDNQKLNRQLASKGKRKAKNYQWDKIVKKFEAVYQQVLDRKGS